MYLGIDVGASKILFAVFDAAGRMVIEHKVATPADYEQFKAVIGRTVKNELSRFEFSHCCCAVPGWSDFKTDTVLAFGNLNWKNVSIKKDLAAILPGVRVLYHNDAKLAGLSEAVLLHKKYRKVLYVTISTGIGGGVIVDELINKDFENFEPGQMVFDWEGKTQAWEDFASGRALKHKYGKLASDIDDPAIWQAYAKTLRLGFEDMLVTVQPDVVVVGGGVGAYFEKFKPYLEDELRQINNPMVPTPPLLKAQRPEEAVIYGCYEYIKQHV